ncbi:hypothetical protein [Halodesulfovibrio sp.]|jgi:hypothetical protein|uniref:hypothetical protein n=1 Tax=Halodesulfovibrio sp. TaxID=1912772 RepID=UPI0025F133F9|nr:hypothetical protein [Halodesulfovibrio sp.]MCT4627928.1 hypothetical protein [Halodesulfovibrio sp.]
MKKRKVLLLVLTIFFIVGCVKKVKMNPVDSHVVSFQSIPFKIQVSNKFYHLTGGKDIGRTGVDKVTLSNGSYHTWSNYDYTAYLYISHLHKNSNMVWLTTANAEGRKLLFVEGIKFWHKKEKVVLQNGESYWEELWMYHTNSDRIYIQIKSKDENVVFDPVKFIPVDVS